MSQNDEDIDQVRIDLGLRLRQARDFVGLSQDEVATALGVSRPAVTNIESGQRKVEAIELNRLAILYGTTVDFLLTGRTETENGQLAFLARATKGLSDSDLDQLMRFTDYLRNSSKTTRRGK
ncbi:helix-turn-helix domain-containing protein [Herbaspirillum frisingense]|uniref:helix-turn-helix domain-containing protein n=1 Tax=Herbaspirillum frisingense TaxID=92645 RepID=UPI0039AFF36B